MKSAVLAALAAAFLLVSTPGRSDSQPSNLETLRLTASLVDGVTPVLYAQSAGLFRQAGFNVVLERASNGSATAAAVVGGSVDIGESNIISMITAHARNVPLVIVAPAAIYDPKTPDAVLLVGANSPLRSARDLIGKTIGMSSLGDISTIATQAWMDADHVDWHAVQFVEVSLPTMQAALDQGRVQAVVQIKPFLTEAVESGKARVLGLVYSSISNHFLESAWFARADFVAAHRETVAKFARIVAQASVYTNAHHAETADLLAAWTGIDPQRAARVPRGVTGTTLQAGEIQPVIDTAAKYGLIPRAFDAHEIMVR
jgi:NitT/TauT family transport system substrate-binding protein